MSFSPVVNRGYQTPGPEIPSLPQQGVGVPPAANHLWNIDPALWNVYPSPASVPASVPAPVHAFQAPGHAYVASGSSGAPAATQEKPKRKRLRNDRASLSTPTTPDNEAPASGAAPANASKRHKPTAKTGTSFMADRSADNNDDDDSPMGPEDPDWDMWIRVPSTTKDGPSAKKTLVAGKLDWRNPVQWSAVTAEKQAQAIRRLRFWMEWTREKAEEHLEQRSRKWISEKKRQAADKENPQRVKRTRTATAAAAGTTSAPVPVGALPVVVPVAPSTDLTSAPPTDTPLFVSAGDEDDHDDMAVEDEDPVVKAILAALSSRNVSASDDSANAPGPAVNEPAETSPDVPMTATPNVQPEDAGYGMMVPHIPAAVLPRLDFSRLAGLGPFLGSQRTGAAATVVPPAILPNGASAGADSEAPAESQQAVTLPSENQAFLNADSVTTAEKTPGLSTTGEM
ncbi:Protein of unknown function [Pyronema omphalodes CBS 100304]|uniref:Uncharacterized protein n=1 Tax=Pyronema omphalodes (strain CBS 100304) TaxID=1076935 RepID=U4L8I6_PYROM|nr:Protein of unknown function [Pyronema omphalodes CBS 100304]